ncbi:hypothetical protein AS159_04105 [Thermotoga sp. Ku-13t]|uniref:hypothetical protein n=1 Tax=Thermotoga sp. Ku-13t TaxID=1755813 RepID=UPI0013EE19DE|nr:hypothetical protein [Thermotoga sp. Ku-13t]KAF2958858.1 hypothetical protein AS159_04105 [Thermotoga sp. Ku-13t]
MSKLDRVALLFGIILTLLGIILLVNAAAAYFWPLFLLSLGFLFEFGMLGKGAGRLVPAGILIVIGTVLLVCSIFGYDKMAYLWPSFIFAPGFGLLQVYFVNRSRNVLKVSMVLITLSGIFFVATFFRIGWARVTFGVLLIMIGVTILIKGVRRKSE